MIGAVLPARAGSPEHGGEDNDGQEEENAEDFEQDFAADRAEGLEKAGEPAGDASGSLASGTAARRWADGRGRLHGWSGSRRGFAHNGLTSRAACQAHSDSENTADGLRSHFDIAPFDEDLSPGARI